MIHDSGGPRRVEPILKRLGVGVWDPGKVVLITDHYVPATDDESARIQHITRQFAADQRIANFYDQQGICHVVLPERGHLKPGMFVVGGDSHSPTGGAFATYMFGIGATEMAGVLATGEIWVRVPETIRIEWTGRLGRGVSAKDMMLHLCARLGMDGGKYQAVEYVGEGVRALPMQERMTLSNMAAELGAQAGLIDADGTTAAFLESVGASGDRIADWRSDPASRVSEHHVFDAGSLSPQVAAPHSPANAAPVEEHAGTAIDVAYIGACTGAKLEDLRMAAEVLRGRKVAGNVELVCAPASLRDQEIARGEGTLAAILDAGASLLPNACGICAGYGDNRLGDNVVAISSTARNFKGRMGASSSKVYLGSPYTTAASAIEGRIADPRPYLQGGRA
jgi:3-isopropylmalate/(R)-2-methylmalate dehydratase large subunit